MNNKTSTREVHDQESLSEFISELIGSKETWSNTDLEAYLQAMAAWVLDMDAYYSNTDQEYDEQSLRWKNVADMLSAATMYE